MAIQNVAKRIKIIAYVVFGRHIYNKLVRICMLW